ncbi:MAG: hypothetical protein GX425_07270 [Peptococcaceae bacterium]|nr:hypothetical protein [Peptococcaceae bacterium]
MKYIWLVIMLMIIVRSIWLQRKRAASRGKLDAPREDLSFDAEDLFFESSPASEPCESGPELDLPEDPAGLGGDSTKVSNDSGYEGKLEKPARERRPDRCGNMDSRREPHGRCGGTELFDGGIGQREFIKGMVWSQILSPRGGIQASKRFRHRY